MASALLSQTGQWADRTPLELPADTAAAVHIQHSADFLDSFGLLYACMHAGEKSDRALKLTERCITLCSAHYTAWDYRFQCLVALDADMEAEWTLCWAIAQVNCKNYQLWNHRRRCALHMGPDNACRELEFAAHFLRKDSKNYHIWAHRQAIVAAFGHAAEEADFVENMIAHDPRNNSAWNQRAWLLAREVACTLVPPADPGSRRLRSQGLTGLLEREAAHAAAALADMPHNESAWNYLCGISRAVASAVAKVPAPEQHQDMVRAALSAVDAAVYAVAFDVLRAHPGCVPAQAALLKQYLRAANTCEAPGPRTVAKQAVCQLCSSLTRADPLHAGWYAHVAQKCNGS